MKIDMKKLMTISRLVINDIKNSENDILAILNYTEIINTQLDNSSPIEEKKIKHIYPEKSRYREDSSFNYNKNLLLENPTKKSNNYFIAPSLIQKEST